MTKKCGKICAMAIGVYSIFTFTKGIIVYFRGCCFVVNKMGKKEAAKYACSPTYFLLSHINHSKKKERQYEEEPLQGNKNLPTAPRMVQDLRPLNDVMHDPVIQNIKNINKNLPILKAT